MLLLLEDQEDENEIERDSLIMEDIIDTVSSYSDELFRLIPEIIYFGFYTRSGNLLFSRKKDPNVKSIIENPLARVTLLAILGGIEKLGMSFSQKIDKVILRMEKYKIYILFLKEAFRAIIITQREIPEGIMDYVLSEFYERVEKAL